MNNNSFIKKKKFGQNFLKNDMIPKRIVSESGIDESCGVIEIGPGLGILTEQLLKAAKKVICIEIDNDLVPILNEKFGADSKFKLINNDVMEIDIQTLIDENLNDVPICVCANLPYYITTPILMLLLESKCRFKTITVMVQKEVAERLCSKKGKSEYGAITVSVNYHATVKKLFNVPSGAFSPPPKVDSAVVRFDMRGDDNRVQTANPALLFKIIKAAFSVRRKILLNALHPLFKDNLPKEKLLEILDCGTFNGISRGETLDIFEFAALTDKINKYIYTEETQ